MSTQTVSPRLARQTREQLRELEANLREQHEDAFNAMKPEDCEAMCKPLDEIISTFEANVENAIGEAEHEAAMELESIVEAYGYDCVKSYTEDPSVGSTADVDATLDLDTQIELL